MSAGWTECGSIRGNASKWILEAVEELRENFPFPVTGIDAGNGSECINHDAAEWLQNEEFEAVLLPGGGDIRPTRYDKGDDDPILYDMDDRQDDVPWTATSADITLGGWCESARFVS